MSKWTSHVDKWKTCTACGYCESRKNVVLARGQLPCDVLFIGEAPGNSEDVIGQPFVGPAGRLLDQLIEEAAGDVALRKAFTNLVGCIPKDSRSSSKNKEPSQEAIEACSERLSELVHLADPKMIVLVGKQAAKAVTGQAQFGGKYDPNDPDYDVDTFVQFTEIVHPSAILQASVASRGLLSKRTVATLFEFFH